MPYKSPSALPRAVQNRLPKHAQVIFKNAFNNAWEEYKPEKRRRGDESREEAAFKVAWAAVKHGYKKEEGSKKWIKRK